MVDMDTSDPASFLILARATIFLVPNTKTWGHSFDSPFFWVKFSFSTLSFRCKIAISNFCLLCYTLPHRRFRGIEWNGVKIYDLQKVTFSTLFKLYIAGLGVLIPKRYHMWV